MRKLISWLAFMMAFCLLLLSCVHDEIYTASDPASKEYHSKSLWKEDEKYIKNVMKIYSEHHEEIKKGTGEPMWDYAMTMDRFDESFLTVPVAEQGKVVAVLNVPRKGQRVYFTYTQVQNDMAFFQNLMSSRLKRAETTLMDNTAGKLVCTTKTISVWIPDNESDSSDGHWESHHVTECKSQQLENCVGEVLSDGTCLGGGGSDPGYPYPGGGGEDQQPEPEQPEDPCQKMKDQLSPSFKSKVDDLKSKLGLKKETGYIENDNGVFTYKDNAAATENANQLSLPNPNLYKDIKGFLHTHPNDFEDSDGNIRKGFKIFSPADVIYFNELVRNAKENGLPLDDVYGVMVSGTGIYQIRFTGNVNQIKTTYVNTGEEYNEMYKKYFLANPKTSDELNFLKFMDEQMYVKGVSLVKMNDNGTFTTKTLNTDKTDVSNSDCPQ